MALDSRALGVYVITSADFPGRGHLDVGGAPVAVPAPQQWRGQEPRQVDDVPHLPGQVGAVAGGGLERAATAAGRAGRALTGPRPGVRRPRT